MQVLYSDMLLSQGSSEYTLKREVDSAHMKMLNMYFSQTEGLKDVRLFTHIKESGYQTGEKVIIIFYS